MLRFLILTVLFSNVPAKLFSYKTFDEEVIQPKSIEPVNVDVEFVNRGDPLWILSLNGDDWMAPKIRLGNTEELKEFFDYIGPLIKKRRRPPVRVKKDDPERPKSIYDPSQKSVKDIKKDFCTIINKFALSSSNEPDAYITDNTHHEYDNGPTIALHFKGIYTALIVELGKSQWRYNIRIQSSIPEWFYEKHDPRESPILVPEDVKIKLFSSLWRMLHTFFGFPVY